MSQTVDRALFILDRIAEEPQSLGMLTESLGVHKSTAYRLVQSLERAGFARRQEDGRYTLGIRLVAIGSKALESLDLRDIARPHLTRLNRLCGHTMHLAS